MAKWVVQVTVEAADVLEGKALSKDDRIVIQTWAQLVRDRGPEALTERPGMWADHPLYGEWRGHRASSFSHSGRIIYKVEEQVVTVTVVRLTADHDYRRKK
jgi:mRNA-degrading endonuclease YafQ of YafQ-DinJ toxin-antitoxin module